VTGPSLIGGVILTELRQIVDKRGAVLHMLRSDGPDHVPIGECYFSEILPGAVKAWKRHRLQTQNLAVPVGRVRLIVYDDRESSSSHGTVETYTLGRPDAYFRVRIPAGLWYGFSCVSETSALLANCTDRPHDPSESDARSLDDPAMPAVWGPSGAVEHQS
jgi:dTDP-4-dehydrorhamnose 3,5-epimerase